MRKGESGVTVISHDSESRTHGNGFEAKSSYSRNIHSPGASLSQLAGLTRVSSQYKQFINSELRNSFIFKGGYDWWMSRESSKYLLVVLSAHAG